MATEQKFQLPSGTGNDVLFGQDGNDTINGGDTLVGGSGNDVFTIGATMGGDVINDFSDGVDAF